MSTREHGLGPLGGSVLCCVASGIPGLAAPGASLLWALRPGPAPLQFAVTCDERMRVWGLAQHWVVSVPLLPKHSPDSPGQGCLCGGRKGSLVVGGGWCFQRPFEVQAGFSE